MRTITVTDYKGHEHSGEWNTTAYESKVSNRPELIRIYINNEQIHICKDEYKRIASEAGINQLKKVTDYLNNEYEGIWNKNTYKSTITDVAGLTRIYLEGKEIHITKKELMKLKGLTREGVREDATESIIRQLYGFKAEDSLKIIYRAINFIANDKMMTEQQEATLREAGGIINEIFPSK